MDSYFEAKALLLERAEQRVVWVDDHYGAILADRYPDALAVGWDAFVGASAIESTAPRKQFPIANRPRGSGR